MLKRKIGRHNYIFYQESVFIEELGYLIIADTHVGYKYYFNEFAAKKHLDTILEKIEGIKKTLEDSGYEIKTLVIDGDIKDMFGYQKKTREMLDRFTLSVKKSFKEVKFILGNHDSGIKGERYLLKDNILIIHGDLKAEGETFNKVESIIIGHQHPAIKLRMGTKVETYKCHAITKYKGRDLIILPNFSPATLGTPLNQTYYYSPFLKENVMNLIVIHEEELYEFDNIHLNSL